MFNTMSKRNFKNLKEILRNAISLALLGMVFFGSGPAMGVGNCELKIFTRNSKVDLNDIKSFFRNADLLVSRTIPTEKVKKSNSQKLPVYNIVLMNKKDFTKIEILDEQNKGIRFYLPEDINEWAKDDRIKARIISAMLLKKAGLDLKDIKKLPPWLVYGILSKTNRRLDKSTIPGIMTFPAIHMLLVTSPAPDLLNISVHPVHQEDGPTYQIFLESSEIIVDTIRRLPQSREGIMDVIDLGIKGFPAKDAFMQAFSKKVYVFKNNTTNDIDLEKLNSAEIINQWLIENAILMAVNTFKPGNAHFAEQQFRKIEIVKYLTIPNKDEKDKKEERFCQVNELLEKKKEIENYNTVIRSKEIDFARLAFSLPSPLQPGIIKIKELLEMLRSGITTNFEKQYNQAKQEFYNGLEKMNKLEGYLVTIELEALPASWQYHRELDELEKWNSKHKKRWPALTEYLDSIENE